MNNPMLASILKNVEKDGTDYVDWVSLRDTSFGFADNLPRPSDQMKIWAKENDLHWEELIVPDDSGKGNKSPKSVIKFARCD